VLESHTAAPRHRADGPDSVNSDQLFAVSEYRTKEFMTVESDPPKASMERVTGSQIAAAERRAEMLPLGDSSSQKAPS